MFSKKIIGAVAAVLFVLPFTASAQSTAELEAQISALLAIIADLQTQIVQLSANQEGGLSSAPVSISQESGSSNCVALTKNLRYGSRTNDRAEVHKLQEYLALDSSIYPEGIVTGFYGRLTEQAVGRWQEKHGVVFAGQSGYGVFGPKTRAKLAFICQSNQPAATVASEIAIPETITISEIDVIKEPPTRPSNLEVDETEDFKIETLNATVGNNGVVTLLGKVTIGDAGWTRTWFEWTDSKERISRDSDTFLGLDYSEKQLFTRDGVASHVATTTGGFVEGRPYYYRFNAEGSNGRYRGEVQAFLIPEKIIVEDEVFGAETLNAVETEFNQFDLYGKVTLGDSEWLRVWFEWAESKDLLKDSNINAQQNFSQKELITRDSLVSHLATIKGGFVEGRPYYYRFGVENNDKRVYGEVQSFLIPEPIVIKEENASKLVVDLDPSSPSYRVVPAGTSQVIGILDVAAIGEEQKLKQIGLQLTGSEVKPADVERVELFHGDLQIGSGFFVGNDPQTTITLVNPVTIPADDSVEITVKAQLSQIGRIQTGTPGAHVRIDFDADNQNTYSVGLNSGKKITHSSQFDTEVGGVRMFKSVPSFQKLALPTQNLNPGENILYRFAITADPAGGDVSFHGLSPFIDIDGRAEISDLNVYGYVDSGFSTPISGVRADGALDVDSISDTKDKIVVTVHTSTGSTVNSVVYIPSGTTRYFEIRGTVSRSAGSRISTHMMGDTEISPAVQTWSGIARSNSNNFIWTGNSIGTTLVTTDRDWANGFGLRGLPVSGTGKSILESDDPLPVTTDVDVINDCFRQEPVDECAKVDFNSDGLINFFDLSELRKVSNYDFSGDGVVDLSQIGADVRVLADCFQSIPTDDTYDDSCSATDIDGDGLINFDDVQAFSQLSKYDLNGDGKIILQP